jgi:1-acyl-sn-glycerol-3-phosphate acyltransferase
MTLLQISRHPSLVAGCFDVAASTSLYSPWLLQLVYPSACYGLLPFYFGSIEVTGQENLPKHGPVILAPTHRSRWDALLVPYAAGRYATGRHPCFMVTANEVQGLQGWMIRRLGGFPINPQQPAIASLRYGLELLQNQEVLVIFPEGGIFRDQSVHTLKPGLARLALQAESTHNLGIKIVPICLRYDRPYPTWGTRVWIRIGTPLVVRTYNCASYKADAKHLTADLLEALSRLNRELQVLPT